MDTLLWMCWCTGSKRRFEVSRRPSCRNSPFSDTRQTIERLLPNSANLIKTKFIPIFHIGKTCDRNLPAPVALLQTATQHRLLRVPDISAQHPDRDAVVGVVLDQPRGDQRPRRPRHHHRPDDDHDQHRRSQFAASHFLRQGDRHLSGHVLRLCVRRPVGVCGR